MLGLQRVLQSCQVVFHSSSGYITYVICRLVNDDCGLVSLGRLLTRTIDSIVLISRLRPQAGRLQCMSEHRRPPDNLISVLRKEEFVVSGPNSLESCCLVDKSSPPNHLKPTCYPLEIFSQIHPNGLLHASRYSLPGTKNPKLPISSLTTLQNKNFQYSQDIGKVRSLVGTTCVSWQLLMSQRDICLGKCILLAVGCLHVFQ